MPRCARTLPCRVWPGTQLPQIGSLALMGHQRRGLVAKTLQELIGVAVDGANRRTVHVGRDALIDVSRPLGNFERPSIGLIAHVLILGHGVAAVLKRTELPRSGATHGGWGR